MKKVDFDFNTGSVMDFGYKTKINLHERTAIDLERSLHDDRNRRGTLKASNEDWELIVFISNAETARNMADKLTEIADFMEENDV